MGQVKQKEKSNEEKANDIKNAAEISCDVGITISGRFLIEHGLADRWLRMRRKALQNNLTIKKHGKITEDFQDHLVVSQARALGIIF